jgi:dimethylglycine dehydrogenase
MLSPRGRLLGDFTITCLSENEFRLTASYGAQAFHSRWFENNRCANVFLENISDTSTGFQIAGPRARDVLAACTRDPVDLNFMDARRMTVGMADCLVQRVSYTGDLGYEIYCDATSQRALWDVLWQAGQAHKMTPFGMRAMMSLRLDRFFGSWMAEYSPDYTAAETGLDRFIDWDKNTDFIGRAAAEAERAAGPARKLVRFDVAADDADVHGYEPIWLNGEVIGFCTSGGYGHHSGASLAMGFLPASEADTATRVDIEILGKRRQAHVVTKPVFDPGGRRLRG